MKTLAYAVLALMFVAGCVACYAKQDFVFYILGSTSCPHCGALKEFLIREYGSEHVVFCPIDKDNECWNEFLEVTRVARLPRAVPITIVIVDGTVRAVVLGGIEDRNLWDSFLRSEGSEVGVYYGYTRVGTVPGDEVARILGLRSTGTAMLTNQGSATIPRTRVEELDLGKMLIRAVTLALLDSINPCTIYLYTLLLMGAILASRKPYAIGAPFILAVFICYGLLGMGMYVLLDLSTYARYALIAAAIALSIANLFKEFSRGKEKLFDLVARACESEEFSFLLGALATVTLLPCSAGPYLVFLASVSSLPIPARLGLHLLYLTIFVSPLIAVTIVFAEIEKVERVRRFLVEHGKVISYVSTALLVLTVLLMLFGIM